MPPPRDSAWSLNRPAGDVLPYPVRASESGHIIVATEMDGPWTIGIYQPCDGTRKGLLDDDNGTHYPKGCGQWCDNETAEFFEFSTQFERLPTCITKALSTYAALTDRHTAQPVNEHGRADARVHKF